MCVHYGVCALGWVECRAQHSEYGSPYFATHHFTYTKFIYAWLCKSFYSRLLSELGTIQGRVSYKVKTHRWSLPHKRERWGEQWSLACKEICTETSHCEQSCFWQSKKGVVLHDHWDHFKKTLKNPTTLWKMASNVPFEAQPPFNQTYFKIRLRINTDLKS